MNNVIMALAFFSSALVGGIAIKNTFERFADEIKTEIAVLATKNNNDIQDMANRLRNVDLKGEKLHVKIYADDYPGEKAEKLYEICATNDELVKVLLQLETLVEKEQQDERSVQQLQNPQVVLSGGAGRGLDL